VGREEKEKLNVGREKQKMGERAQRARRKREGVKEGKIEGEKGVRKRRGRKES
jgi:hypothetical protein